VYRGLARLLGPPAVPPRAVIVCLDGLGTPEFEFFSILSRVRRDLKVYVYGSAGAEARIAKAVECGATGSVTEEVLSELAGGPLCPPEAEAPVRTPERRNDIAVAPADPPPDPADQTPRTMAEEDARKPARVPWLRYGDRPARVAPSHRELPPQAPNPNPQTPNPPRSYEPLLTEEELQALMSDDIAAIAADEPDARRPHDDDPTRGVP
jgi:hypothetical protein